MLDAVRTGALILRELLAKVGLTSFVMTTGSRGLHVVVPLDARADFDSVRDFAVRVVAKIARENTERFTNEQRKSKRGNRVFIDVARNAYAQTGVASYSVRARERPTIAAPLDWKEVHYSKLTPTDYTIHNIFHRLGQKKDPWRDIDKYRGSIQVAGDKFLAIS